MKCPWCEDEHPGICPKIAAIELDEDGTTWRRIEFVQAGTAPKQLRLSPETDAELRDRLALVTKGTVNEEKAMTAIGAALDEVASFYGMERKKAGEA